MSDVIGFHVIACTYGFWLPNDQRGSCSDYVRAPHLTRFGPANPVDHARSVARMPFDFQLRKPARESLRYPYVEFTDQQIAAVGRGVAREIERYGAAPTYAFVQLRDHFHYVCGRCRYDIRRFAGRLKGAATRQLLEEGLHPLAEYADARGHVPSPWSVKPWVVYLFTDDAVTSSIDYANNNLRRARLPPQAYPFIVPYAPSVGCPARGGVS
jgi:hypothetical protein